MCGVAKVKNWLAAFLVVAFLLGFQAATAKTSAALILPFQQVIPHLRRWK